MAIPAPVIVLPSGGIDYATDTRIQTLSGTTISTTEYILVNNSTLGVSYTPGETAWSWTGNVNDGVNIINIIAIEQITGLQSVSATINIIYAPQDITISISAPTGVRMRRYQDKVEVITSKNPEANVIGYNFYVSYQSGGVDNNYIKMNSQLVDTASFYEDDIVEIGETVNTVGNIRITTKTEEIDRIYYYSYFFDEALYNEMVQNEVIPNVGFNQDTSFYFIVTAVIYDPLIGQVAESTYSLEMESSPITITTGIVDLPSRTQTDIILTATQELLGVDAGIDMKPGTVLRDMMDPISEEQARTYIIQDFLARSLSVSALQDFDDADGDGVSDPVNTSVRKKALQIALYINDPNQIQIIIDDQFDKLASNVNVIRRGASSAVGTVIFYTTQAPIRNMVVNEGALVASLGDVDNAIPSQAYRCTETKIMSYENRSSFFNTLTQRYELEVAIEAVTTGSIGNTDSYSIRTISSGADSDFLVENINAVQFGQDSESNHDMSGRMMLALFADTGTEGGYARTSIAVSGVRGVRVEKAGDPLMWRDYDSIRQEHIGGKVDIYIQGSRIRQVSDVIAFSFESGSGGLSGEQFLVINALSFQFKTENSRVTAHTPIFEVTRVYNATRAKEYDISNYHIIGDGDTIELDETLVINTQVGLASADIVRVDYRYRSSDVFVLKHQPVQSLVSVTGQISGPLPSDNYELVKLEDPIQNGSSTIAQDGIRIKYANGLPSTEFISVTDEPHVMIQGVNEKLNYIGVDPQSILVTSSDKTKTYMRDADYTVQPGTDTTATTILLMDTGLIQSGEEVLISYIAIENFTVIYTVNSLLETVQKDIDKTKHACADVIVKQAVENDIDLIMTVVPRAGVTNLEQLMSKIVTAVTNYVGQLGIGVTLTQSDVVHIVKGVPDVDYVVLPLMRMIKADGSFIARDNIGTPSFQVYNQGLSISYITSVSVLSYNTIAQGGPSNFFRGVFEGGLPLVLQEDPLDVSGGSGRAYIMADGRLVVSTKDGNLPDTKTYQVAYYVYNESGSEDIITDSLEYLSVGSFSITFDTPRETTKQAL